MCSYYCVHTDCAMSQLMYNYFPPFFMEKISLPWKWVQQESNHTYFSQSSFVYLCWSTTKLLLLAFKYNICSTLFYFLNPRYIYPLNHVWEKKLKFHFPLYMWLNYCFGGSTLTFCYLNFWLKKKPCSYMILCFFVLGSPASHSPQSLKIGLSLNTRAFESYIDYCCEGFFDVNCFLKCSRKCISAR